MHVFFLLLGREEGEACWNAGEIPEEILVIVTIALAAEKCPPVNQPKREQVRDMEVYYFLQVVYMPNMHSENSRNIPQKSLIS